MSSESTGPILTLEPLIDAVREGVETSGWELSGLQKTTSHQFEGRWEGDSTRSAYLFFHHPEAPEAVSIDVYLDETTRGLAGNLALVVDLVPLGRLGGAARALTLLREISRGALPDGYRTPLTLRLRLGDPHDDVDEAEAEVRFKLRMTRRPIESGHAAVRDLAAATVAAFGRILEEPRLLELMSRDG